MTSEAVPAIALTSVPFPSGVSATVARLAGSTMARCSSPLENAYVTSNKETETVSGATGGSTGVHLYGASATVASGRGAHATSASRTAARITLTQPEATRRPSRGYRAASFLARLALDTLSRRRHGAHQRHLWRCYEVATRLGSATPCA